MCGIVGYVGHGPAGSRPLDVVFEGFARLEYRRYDSAGAAVTGPEGMSAVKRAGRLDSLRAALARSSLSPSTVVIGHTRWVTHGGLTDENVCPHVSLDDAVTIVYNGIIENYSEPVLELNRRGIFRWLETDTEIAAHHLASEYAKDGNLFATMCRLASRLQGSFTLMGMAGDFEVVAACRNLPLVAGLGEGGNSLGSDVVALVGSTPGALELDQGTAVSITADEVTMVDSEGRPAEDKCFEVNWDLFAAAKDGYEMFMDKETHEQPKAVAEMLRGCTSLDGCLHPDELRIDESVLHSAGKIIIAACGTAAYAGHVAKYAIEHWCRAPVEVELAHEFRYRDPVANEKTLVVVTSQSGETMGTLMVIRHVHEQGSKVLAIVNTHGSTIVCESDAVLYTHVGSEVVVASTKTLTAQITVCYLLDPYLSELRGDKYVDEVATYLDELGKMPSHIEEVLTEEEQVHMLARSAAGVTSALFLSRHVDFLVALEGAFKLKELAYTHTEGFAVGELKHSPTALIEEGPPVSVVVPTPRCPLLHSKVVSNLQKVKARGTHVIVIVEEGDGEAASYATRVFWVPWLTPTLMMPPIMVVPLQIFTCELASAKGYDVDKLRNLAKSMTVE